MILVVDDSLENRLVLKSLLETVGFRVVEAANGQDALKVIDQSSPDFVWMDMRMPVMSGYDAVRQIRQRPGGVTLPVVALTASAFHEQRPEMIAAGCDDMVSKPFEEHEIFEVMARFLDLTYVYEDDDRATRRGSLQGDLTAAMVGAIPTELRQALERTTLVLDMEATLAVIERIEGASPETAGGLRKLVEGFEIDRIRQLLQEAGGSAVASKP